MNGELYKLFSSFLEVLINGMLQGALFQSEFYNNNFVLEQHWQVEQANILRSNKYSQ